MSQAPRVAAVVVAHHPGEYFEDCLVSIAESNYPNLHAIVVDTSSDDRVAHIVADRLPDAHYHRIDHDSGYSQAANIGAEFDNEASHLLFLHDDAALAPEAISAMMEVAFSKNAGLVTPKYLVWESPGQILQLGMSLDKTAAPASRVDVGDLDQAQYDGVEEVTVAPGGAMLVRADLFRALGGFDPSIELFGEDIDLSCRVHVVGAKVYTAPLAKVRHKMVATLSDPKHREGRRSLRRVAVGRGGMDRIHRLKYSRRHQLRVILKDFVGRGRKRALLRFIVLSIFEIAYYLLSGRPRLALAVVQAFSWNFGLRRDLRERRRELKALASKAPPPLKLTSGSARIAAYLQARRSLRRLALLAAEEDLAEVSASNGHRSRPEEQRVTSGLDRLSKALLWIVGLGLTFSLWTLVFGPLPLLGSFESFPSLSAFFSSYIHGTYTTASYGRGVAPPAYVFYGLLSILTLGSGAALQHLLLVLAVAGGAVGIYRLTRREGSPMAARFAAAIYLLVPILSQAFSNANFNAVIGFGLVPWMLILFYRAVTSQRASRRSMRRANLVLGLFGAFCLAISPPIFITFVIFVVARATFARLTGSVGASRRTLFSIFVCVVVAFLVDLPWSVSLFDSTVGVARVFGGLAPTGISFSHLLGFSTTPGYSPSIFTYGVLVFALASTWFARGSRVLAIGGHLLGFAFFLLLAALDTSGVFGGNPIPLWVFLGFAAISLVQSVGLGFDALSSDLPRYRLGMRHLLAVVAGLSFVGSSLFFVKGLTSQRLGLPRSGFETSLSFLGGLSKGANVLWLGDPNVMPVQGWKLTNGLSVALESQVRPDFRSQFVPQNYGAAAPIVSALRSAIAGDTVQLGAALAKSGVEYVVVPQPIAAPGFFVGTDLDLIFERQVDLSQLLVDPSVVAFKVADKPAVLTPQASTWLTVARFGGIFAQLATVFLILSGLLRRRALLMTLTTEGLRRRLGRVRRPHRATTSDGEDNSEIGKTVHSSTVNAAHATKANPSKRINAQGAGADPDEEVAGDEGNPKALAHTSRRQSSPTSKQDNAKGDQW